MNLPDNERAYIAGLIDGEGSISVARSGSWLQLFVSVSMTDRVGPELLKRYYGGSLARADRLRLGHKPYWAWKVTGIGCLSVLRDIEPFCKVKHRQVELGLKFILTIQRNNTKYSAEEIKLRNKIARRLRRLNKRGTSENLGR